MCQDFRLCQPVWLCSCSLFKREGTTWTLITLGPGVLFVTCLALGLLILEICLEQKRGLGFTGRQDVLQGSGHQARPCDAFSGHQPRAMIWSCLLPVCVPDYLALGDRCDLSVSFQIKHKGFILGVCGSVTNHTHTMGTPCCLWSSSIWPGLGGIADPEQPFVGSFSQHSIKDQPVR